MLIKRELEDKLIKSINSNKAKFIFGARQVGKTTLIKQITDKLQLPVRYFVGDSQHDREILRPLSVNYLKQLIDKASIIVIDEAHKFEEIDNTIKLIVDNLPGTQVIATGSSAFILKARTSDSLAGRKKTFNIYPLTFKELKDHFGFDTELKSLEERLIFGSYPEVVTTDDKKELLDDLQESYLFKDILEWEGIRKSQKLQKLLTALAFQVGSQVKYRELASLVGLDTTTVEKYIDILEQSFIIFRLPSFSKNLRNELKYSRKIYFWDLGIRNSLIKDFRPLAVRNDTGALWENYIIAERIKRRYYSGKDCSFYFWRTKQAQEIDLIEICDGQISAFELKFNPQKKARLNKTFANAYPEASFSVINRQNYWEILLED